MHQLKWIEQRVETCGNLNKISGYASTEMDKNKEWKPEQDIRVCIN